MNPAARGGRSAESEALVALGAAGVAVDLQRTSSPGHAARLAAAAPPDATIYVLGGDGTVMEVVGASVGTARTVGILPGGTGNQLARNLGIPLRVGAAVRALRQGAVRTFDLGRLADGRHFALTAGLGIDAAMIAGTPVRAKRWLGVAAYFVGGARPVLAARPFPVTVETDGMRLEREAALAMIANVGSVMGGRIAFGPNIAPDDGWLDLCVLTPRGVADGLALTWRAFRGNFRDDPRMLFVRAQAVRIEAPAGVPAQADGELLRGSVLDARVVAGGARFLAPAT